MTEDVPLISEYFAMNPTRRCGYVHVQTLSLEKWSHGDNPATYDLIRLLVSTLAN